MFKKKKKFYLIWNSLILKFNYFFYRDIAILPELWIMFSNLPKNSIIKNSPKSKTTIKSMRKWHLNSFSIKSILIYIDFFEDWTKQRNLIRNSILYMSMKITQQMFADNVIKPNAWRSIDVLKNRGGLVGWLHSRIYNCTHLTSLIMAKDLLILVLQLCWTINTKATTAIQDEKNIALCLTFRIKANTCN